MAIWQHSRQSRTFRKRIGMAHTIEEIKSAKETLCEEIAMKLSKFETQYGVYIDFVDYSHTNMYSEYCDDPMAVKTDFIICLKL